MKPFLFAQFFFHTERGKINLEPEKLVDCFLQKWRCAKRCHSLCEFEHCGQLCRICRDLARTQVRTSRLLTRRHTLGVWQFHWLSSACCHLQNNLVGRKVQEKSSLGLWASFESPHSQSYDASNTTLWCVVERASSLRDVSVRWPRSQLMTSLNTRSTDSVTSAYNATSRTKSQSVHRLCTRSRWG